MRQPWPQAVPMCGSSGRSTGVKGNRCSRPAPICPLRASLTVSCPIPRALGGPPRMPLSGSVGAVVEALGAFQALGVEHVVFETATQSHHGTLATMEAFMQKVQPQLA